MPLCVASPVACADGSDLTPFLVYIQKVLKINSSGLIITWLPSAGERVYVGG